MSRSKNHSKRHGRLRSRRLQMEDVFGRSLHQPDQAQRKELDYDDVVEQSFPASDPPPPPG